MLILLFLYAYIWYVGYNWGALFYKFILKSAPQNKTYNFIIGLVLLSGFSRIWSILLPIGMWHTIALILPALLNTKNLIPDLKQISKKQVGIFCVIAVPIVFFCSQQSISYDEALYHASFIQWMNDFGIVKGLGNLHGRLAFNSTWHLVASCFNMQFLRAGFPLNQINGLLLLWFIAFFHNEIQLNERLPQIRTFSWIATICLFFPPIFVYHIIDPSSDFIVCFIALIILYETYFFDDKREGTTMLWNLVILSFWLVTIKVSSLTILILLLFIGGRIIRSQISFVGLAGILGLILIPWLVSNFLLSGYILYPTLKLGTAPAWQIPEKIAHIDLEGIKYSPFMRWIQVDLEAVLKMGFAEKYIRWFKGIRIYDKALFITGFMAHIWMLLRFKKLSSIKIQAVWISLAGLIFVVLTAPDFRFAAAYIFFILAISLSEITIDFNLNYLGKLAIAASAMLFISSIVLYRHLKKEVPVTLKTNTKKIDIPLVFPIPYPKTRFTEIIVNGSKLKYYNESKNEFNWNNNPGTYDATLNINTPYKNINSGIFPSRQ